MTDIRQLDVAEMDAMFRRADFAAENPGLETRLWAKIQARLSAQDQEQVWIAGERELSEMELSDLAAAGAPEIQAAGNLVSVLRQNERGRP